MKYKGLIFIRPLACLLVLYLLGCNAANKFIPTPSPTPDPRTKTEESLSVFMQNYIIDNEIVPMLDIFKTENIPGLDAPPEAQIIVWSPIIADYQTSDPFNWLDTPNAYKVWKYGDKGLVVQEDEQGAIADYQHKYMNNNPSIPSIFTWGYYEYGIVSITEDLKSSKVYLSASCGSACGHGILFTLKLNDKAEWEISELQAMWGS